MSCISRKIIYPTLAAVTAKADRMNSLYDYISGNENWLTPYPCTDCDGFHIGRKNKAKALKKKAQTETAKKKASPAPILADDQILQIRKKDVVAITTGDHLIVTTKVHAETSDQWKKLTSRVIASTLMRPELPSAKTVLEGLPCFALTAALYQKISEITNIPFEDVKDFLLSIPENKRAMYHTLEDHGMALSIITLPTSKNFSRVAKYLCVVPH